MVKLKHEDVLRAIEAESTWTNASSACSVCHYKEVDDFCEVPGGRICVSCAEKALNEANVAIKIAKWPAAKFIDALSPKGRLRWRMMAVYRFFEIKQYLKQSDEMSQLYALLVDNLGFISPHPLAHTVRQCALNRCIDAGEHLLPILLEKIKPSPWEFYANVLVAAIKIDSDNPKVQKLMQQAAKHSNPEVREKLVFAMSSVSDMQAFSLLTRLTNDSNFHVRTLARQTISKFKQQFQPRTQFVPKYRNETRPKNSGKSSRPNPGIAFNDPILKVVEENYTIENLRKFYREYLKEFVPYKKFGLPDQTSSVHKLRRVDLAFALKTVLESKEMFLKMFSRLPEATQKIVNLIVWVGAAHEVELLEKQFGCEIYSRSEDRRHRSKLLPVYYLFAINEQFGYWGQNSQFFLYLPKRFQQIIKKYLPFPDFAKLRPLTQLPKTRFIQELDDGLVAQVFNLFRYVSTGNVKFSKTSNRLLKKSIREIEQHFNIQEYFDTSAEELNHVKLHLLVYLLIGYQGKLAKDPLSFFKQMFQDFFSGPKNLHSFRFGSLMTHLKGGGDDLTTLHAEIRYRKSFHKILKSLPPGEWIEFSNLQMNIQCREFFIELIELDYACYNLSYKLSFGINTRYHYVEKSRVQANNYLQSVMMPLLKGTLFLFAAFGLLDVLYDLPWADSEEKEYLTPYDGIRAIRLTKLGAFVLGLKKDFNLKTDKPDVKITLDEKHLIIYLEGVDPVKTMLLEKIGEPINPTCFKVTFQSFLKGCSSEKDIKNKLKFFKQHISPKPPENWKQFLDTVRKKMNPLTAETDVAVFKIEPERELIELISRDEVLRKKVVKAENFRIIIAAKDLRTVKKRLEEFGYFIDSW